MAEILHWLTLYAPVLFSLQMWFGPGWCCPPPCECRIEAGYCTEGERPCEYGVTISGITNGVCTGCSEINGTYILTDIGVDAPAAYRFDGDWSTTWPNLRIRYQGSATCFDWTAISGSDVFRFTIAMDVLTNGNGDSRIGNLYIGDTTGIRQNFSYRDRDETPNSAPYPCLTTKDMTGLTDWFPSNSPGPSCNISAVAVTSWPV